MSTFPGTPAVLKGGLVLLDPTTGAVRTVISLQYNPDAVSRTLQIRTPSSEDGQRSDAFRVKGLPVETIRLDAEIDATDQLEFPDQGQNREARQSGILSALAALETVVYPTSAQLQTNNQLAASGVLEILPMISALVLFVWSRNRIVPVRITELSVAEEAFDVTLNPIRARVTLGMRVLSVDDLGFDNKGGGLFMSYLQRKEGLAGRRPPGTLRSLGLDGIS